MTVINNLCAYYDQVIDQTIAKHNESIYLDFKKFLESTSSALQNAVYLKSRDNRAKSIPEQIAMDHASQVPTCLVITRSESASSVDAQFLAMQKQIKKEINQAVTVMLDEKKCSTMKNTVEHI